MVNIEDIAQSVLERTRDGRLSWEATVHDHVFQAVIGDKSILVEDQGPAYRLRILDELGRELDACRDTRGSLLEEVYTEAKRRALNADAQLSDLLQKLQA